MAKHSHSDFSAVFILATGLISLSGSVNAQGSGSTFGTENTVNDAIIASMGAGIGSDGDGAYVDGTSCVTGVGGSQGGGVSKFWTVDNNDSDCRALERGDWRYLTFDFGLGNAPGDLDGIGGPQQIELAPARWGVNSPFKSAPNAHRIVIYVLGVGADGKVTEEGKAWRLEYKEPGSVNIVGDSRVITPDSLAEADLYQTLFTPRGKKVWREEVHLGTFFMPFHLTVAPSTP
jgi:hypothetical protein